MRPESGETLVGKYELREIAGEGGMASVYRARTRGAAGFQRPVAVKRLHPALSDDPEFVTMFVEEARVVSELQHPNIVQIHDFDQDEDGTYFLVMEWVEGLNLLDWSIAHRRAGVDAPWPLVAAVGIEVLKALTAAHEHTNEREDLLPIYHRDVTPQNILLSTAGVVKLTDFGLARAMDRSRITQPEMVKGKISYLAPELTEGADPSPQTDIFGVGVVLWEVLAGDKLFKGENPLQIIRAIRAGDVPLIGERRKDVPDELGAVVATALATDPAARYPTTRAMVRALSNLLRGTPSSTGADVLAQSVREARRWLTYAAPAEGSAELDAERDRQSPSVTMVDFEEEGHVPLTRRRNTQKPSAGP
jgi:eukaryotic-like serine/threonine-protein kinase